MCQFWFKSSHIDLNDDDHYIDAIDHHVNDDGDSGNNDADVDLGVDVDANADANADASTRSCLAHSGVYWVRLMMMSRSKSQISRMLCS